MVPGAPSPESSRGAPGGASPGAAAAPGASPGAGRVPGGGGGCGSAPPGPSAPNFGEVQVPPPATPSPPRFLPGDEGSAKKTPKFTQSGGCGCGGVGKNDLGGKWQNGPEGGTGRAGLGMAGPAAPGSFPSWKRNPHSWLRFLTPVGISIFLCVFFPHRVFFNLGARVLFLSYFFVRDFEEPKTAGELEAGGILLWECSGGWDPQDPPTLPVGDTLWGLNRPVCGDSCKNKHQPSNPHFPPKFLKVLPSLAVSVSGEG